MTDEDGEMPWFTPETGIVFEHPALPLGRQVPGEHEVDSADGVQLLHQVDNAVSADDDLGPSECGSAIVVRHRLAITCSGLDPSYGCLHHLLARRVRASPRCPRPPKPRGAAET